MRETKLLFVSDEGIQAIKPNTFTVATKDCPLSRRLYFYMPKDGRKQKAHDFVEFFSEEDQSIMDQVDKKQSIQ